jgi:MYXO-CTERM domain-containing protein
LDTAVPVTSAAQLTDEKGGFACSSAPASGSTWFGMLALALLTAVGRRSR